MPVWYGMADVCEGALGKELPRVSLKRLSVRI